jgi:putative hemin transport protein
MTITENSIERLRAAWKGIQHAKPGIRIREAAADLGSSEAELLATTIGDETVRLDGNWQDLVKRLPVLGRVMSLTRNNGCILEHKGAFQKINTFGNGDHAMGTVVGPIESRIFFSTWHVAFAVKQRKDDRDLISLQVFDQAGEAITKIYLQEKSDFDAFEKIMNDFASTNQSPEQFTKKYPADDYETDINKESLLEDWAELKDTHDFFPMLKKYNAHRHYALELAEGKFSYRIDPSGVQQILQAAATEKLPIMIFAGNRGNLQIHQGKVKTIRLIERGHTGEEKWLNVLDPDFNMHLRMDHVKEVWVVTKPTQDGQVTSVEVFDSRRDLIVQFFGLRKPGIQQFEGWKSLVNSLPRIQK